MTVLVNTAANALIFFMLCPRRCHSESAEFGKLVADETAKWAKVVEFAGVKVE